MAKGTVALPTLYNVRLRQAVRIAVGIRREGKGAPQKLDHFVLTRWSPQAKSYVIDREAMQALGEEKPTRLPVLVMANLEVVPDAVTGEPHLERRTYYSPHTRSRHRAHPISTSSSSTLPMSSATSRVRAVGAYA